MPTRGTVCTYVPSALPGFRPRLVSRPTRSRPSRSSRRAAEKLIADGRVTVNGATVHEMGTKADPSRDDIRIDGRRIKAPERHRYILLNKPSGYVTTRSDPQRRRTVIDLLRGVKE